MIDAEDDDYVALASALRVLRKRAGLTQAQVADVVGVRNTYISQVEHAQKGVATRTLLKMLKAYGATLRDLVNEIERGEG
jgi:transcriptional regulator with XRE-family HTH domain